MPVTRAQANVANSRLYIELLRKRCKASCVIVTAIIPVVTHDTTTRLVSWIEAQLSPPPKLTGWLKAIIVAIHAARIRKDCAS